VAEAHLTGVDDPLADLVSRYARTHGPFTTAEAAARFGLGTAVVADVLRRLARDGRLTEGEFRPQATGSEWIEPGVLRRLRSRSLAAARKQVEPVDPAALARFLPSWQGVGSLRGVEGVLSVVDQLAGLTLPASAWESLVLPSRVVDYSPAMLDELLGAGEVVWTGAGTLPGHDGWVQLHPADLVLPVVRDAPEPGVTGRAVLDALDGGGAFLFRQLTAALDEPDDGLIAEALWQLVWAGRVAGDTFAPLRAVLGNRGAHRSSSRSPRARLRSARGRASSLRTAQQGPPTVTGRWFRLEPSDTDPTKLQLARTEALLARYGVVTRGSVVAEQTPGGFAATYRVLRELEQTGACLRGYYIDTLGAAQFASPATVDRLRSHQREDSEAASDTEALVLAATDPANPFGAALPWPEVVDANESSRHRPARKAGSLVVIHDGHAVLYLERGGRKVLAFHDDPVVLAAAATALADLVRTGRVPRLTVETSGGRSVGPTAVGAALREAGFVEHPKGLRLSTGSRTA
jgi:ATP-dependent Lhr-like helicase